MKEVLVIFGWLASGGLVLAGLWKLFTGKPLRKRRSFLPYPSSWTRKEGLVLVLWSLLLMAVVAVPRYSGVGVNTGDAGVFLARQVGVDWTKFRWRVGWMDHNIVNLRDGDRLVQPDRLLQLLFHIQRRVIDPFLAQL